jgi:hypothetical protein
MGDAGSIYLKHKLQNMLWHTDRHQSTNTRKGKTPMPPVQTHAVETNIPRRYLEIVMMGIVLLAALEVLVQLLPPHYNPITQSESDLAVGPYGFLMAGNFALRGVLYLLFIAAYVQVVPLAGQSRSGLVLLVLAAIGKIIIAFAPTELTARPTTLHGTIHAIAALGSFFCGALGSVLLARALRRMPHFDPPAQRLLRLAEVICAWSLVVIGTVAIADRIGIWGVGERVLTLLFFAWIFITARELQGHLTAPQ